MKKKMKSKVVDEIPKIKAEHGKYCDSGYDLKIASLILFLESILRI